MESGRSQATREASLQGPLLPQWTEPSGAAQGRNHLGMQSPSISLYAGLVPGITNVTLRVRYYSFYPWICDQYAQRVGETSVTSFRRFIRRAEALLALCCFEAAPKVPSAWISLGGIDWAQKESAKGASVIDFREAAEPGSMDPYLAARTGVFGQAYLGPLRDIGILGHAAKHPHPVPGPGDGEELAMVFAESVGTAGSVFVEALLRGDAARAELQELGAAFRADLPRQGGVERDILHEALFRQDPSASTGPFRHPSSRRESLLLFLHVASREVPDRDSVCWALYSGFGAEGLSLDIPEPLLATAGMWRAYQANELSHLLVESWLQLLLEILPRDRGIGVEEALQEFSEALVGEWTGAMPETWKALRRSIELADNPRDDEASDGEFRLAREVLKSAPTRAAAAALRLLAVLDQRWSGTSHSVGDTFAPTLGELHHQSLMGVLRFFRDREEQPLLETLVEFVRSRIIEQHLRVALTKLRYQGKRTFLFELVDGRLRALSEIEPGWTNPRIETSLSFLRDLALLEERKPPDEDSVLTALGRQTMEAL